MKFFQQWFVNIATVSSAIGYLSIASLPAQAIPEAQVIEKLQNIPVYVITDDKGVMVQATSEGAKTQPQQISTGVFFTSQDAQSFLDRSIRKQQPDLIKVVKITPVSLGEIYRRKQANKNKPQELNYVYVPAPQQVSAALEILKQNGQKIAQITDQPVFIATTISKSGKEEYLTFQRGGQDIIPLFFSRDTLQATVKKVYPNLSAKSKIQVVELTYLLDYMTTTNDSVINYFEFNPNMNGK